ncbi:MAG: hypothetical protein K2W82_09455 [Candidatus Obscuribacterales bacterium]|nr:hypothetical protein [Candidatus Obscuribacterales bacterium]
MNVDINQLLFEELQKEPDELSKAICKLTIELAQDATNKGITNIADHVSNVLDQKLTRIFREFDK